MKTLLTAEWVAPMTMPPIRAAGVVFDDSDGRVVAVGPDRDLRTAHPDAAVTELGAVVLLPGLVNAHAHLELSDLRYDPTPPARFVDWLLRVIREAPPPEPEQHARITRATEIGISMSVRSGVTCVGDITRNPDETRRLLKASPLRAVSAGEVTGMAGRRAFAEPRLLKAVHYSEVSNRLRMAASPHAPYSIEPAGYRRCLQEAVHRQIVLTTHLAETPDEAAFLDDHAGPLRELWDAIGGWDDAVPRFAGGPIRFAQALGLLDFAGSLLAHVNYCDDDELALLAAGRASVAYCPRTHRYFGHPPHRFRDMLAAGINVAVGTDSCASSPDLNLVDDLRLVHEIAPDMPADEVWQMATTRAARALRWEREIGSIEAGKAADFVAFDVSTDQPLLEILENRRLPAGVWIAGRRLVS